MMELFAIIADGFQLLIIFVISSVIDVSQGSDTPLNMTNVFNQGYDLFNRSFQTKHYL